MIKNHTEFEYRVHNSGHWIPEAGWPENCVEGFKSPAPPRSAVDYNGIELPPFCIKKIGLHKVFVIGDWGGVLGPHGPKPANQRSKEWFLKGVDDRAQQRVAAQMQERAKHHAPDYILSMGDTFYWSGLDIKCGVAPAFQITPTGQLEHVFENIYKGEGIDGKPWLGVLGNHDYGGYMFNRGWDQLIYYTWGPGGRWVMPAQYWRTKVHYPGFSIDYWFVDTNAATAHEPHADPDHNICSNKHIHKDAGCGEEGPRDVWHCPSWFKTLWEEQQVWLEKGLSESKTTWQIVVTHFPPTWYKAYWEHLSEKYGIDLFLTGHMHHQELHYEDPGNFLYPTAWIISGGGGGITSEGRPNADGIDDQYGFYELTLTKDVIEIKGISHGGLERSHVFLRPRVPGQVSERPKPPYLADDRNHERPSPKKGEQSEHREHDEKHGIKGQSSHSKTVSDKEFQGKTHRSDVPQPHANSTHDRRHLSNLGTHDKKEGSSRRKKLKFHLK